MTDLYAQLAALVTETIGQPVTPEEIRDYLHDHTYPRRLTGPERDTMRETLIQELASR